MAHAVQKVVGRCEVAKENGGRVGKEKYISKKIQLKSSSLLAIRKAHFLIFLSFIHNKVK
jgi:hypothetical protein